MTFHLFFSGSLYDTEIIVKDSDGTHRYFMPTLQEEETSERFLDVEAASANFELTLIPQMTDYRSALSEMEIGETRLIESDYGYHLIMKYGCEDGAYDEEANKIWFTDFNSLLIEKLFLQETEKHMSKIKIDKELLATVDMKSVTVNYYY